MLSLSTFSRYCVVLSALASWLLGAEGNPESSGAARAREEFARPVVLQPEDRQVLASPPAGFLAPVSSEDQGRVESFTYFSTITKRERKAKVYLPPHYNPRESYPVLYLLHGIGGDENEWLGYVQLQALLDRLYLEKRAIPMVVVLPNGRAQEDDRAVGDPFTPEKIAAFANFEQDLLHCLIPAVESQFGIGGKGEHRALAGLSMGGGQALNFGLKAGAPFSYVGAFSPAPNTEENAVLLAQPDELKSRVRVLYLSCGAKDGLIRVSQRVQRGLATYEVPHLWNVDPHAHDRESWSANLYHFAQRLFR